MRRGARRRGRVRLRLRRPTHAGPDGARCGAFGLWVVILAAVVFGILYNRGLGEDSIRGWSSALYGSKREDANHWSRTGGKRKR